MPVSLKVRILFWGFMALKGGHSSKNRHFATLKLHIVHSFDMNTRPAIFLTTLPVSINIKTAFVCVSVCVGGLWPKRGSL